MYLCIYVYHICVCFCMHVTVYRRSIFMYIAQVALMVKNLPANAGDLRDASSIPGLGRSSGEGNGNPLQYSCLENYMVREPGGLQSMGSQRIGHDLSDLACICKYIYMHVCVCIFENTQSSHVKTVLLGKDGKTYACRKHDFLSLKSF